MSHRETLCWRCTRPGTGTCSWDKNLTPVEGWDAVATEWREGGHTWCVTDCPLFEPVEDYRHRMTHICVGSAKRGPKTPEVRERIYQLIRDGFRNEAIAREVGVSLETVKTYRRNWRKAQGEMNDEGQ